METFFCFYNLSLLPYYGFLTCGSQSQMLPCASGKTIAVKSGAFIPWVDFIARNGT